MSVRPSSPSTSCAVPMCMSTSLALSWHEMKCAFVYTPKTEPSGDVKNIGPAGLERDDVVKTGRILLINKARLTVKD